jgi:Pyruvate/2-oxoacid:ferredoxin oxidoreductase delta subunit
MKYLCLYYSGTGNTERAMEIVRRGIEDSGSSVEVLRAKARMDLRRLPAHDQLIVAFPVYSFAPPVFFKKLMRALPRGERPDGSRERAWIMAVDGEDGMSAASIATRVLSRRGYEVVTSLDVSYPPNWTEIVNPYEPERNEKMIAGGDALARQFLQDILAGKSSAPNLNRDGFRPIEIISFLFGIFGRRFLGKLYIADRDCNRCGLCARICPASAIVLKDGKRARPYWRLNCESCNACVNRCPKRAINTSLARLATLAAGIVLACVAGIWAYYVPFKSAIGAFPSGAAGKAIDAAAVAAIVVIAHLLVAGPLDAFFLRWFQRLPGLSRLFEKSFTKGYRRYVAPKGE